MILATFTENGTVEPSEILSGQYGLALEGSFGGGTLAITFKDANDDLALTANSEWSFTASPAFPQAYGIPAGTKMVISLSGATSPSLSVRAYRYYG